MRNLSFSNCQTAREILPPGKAAPVGVPKGHTRRSKIPGLQCARKRTLVHFALTLNMDYQPKGNLPQTAKTLFRKHPAAW
jgi:hypothetical protein